MTWLFLVSPWSLVLSAPTLSAGNPGAASPQGTEGVAKGMCKYDISTYIDNK